MQAKVGLPFVCPTAVLPWVATPQGLSVLGENSVNASQRACMGCLYMYSDFYQQRARNGYKLLETCQLKPTPNDSLVSRI